jgi:VWFA-related protein
MGGIAGTGMTDADRLSMSPGDSAAPTEQNRGDRTLETFAAETGGRAFFPFELEELAVNFADISQELRSQYSLSYRPTNLSRDGSYREVRIEPLDDDFDVKHREGYYAPRENASDPVR